MSLKETLKQAILELVINCDSVKKYCKSTHLLDLNKVLILDEKCVHYLKEILKPSELTEMGFINTQSIKTALQPLNIHLIYCIEPKDENFLLIQTCLNKYSVFKTVHIFCFGNILDSQINMLKSDAKILNKLATLREIPLSCYVIYSDLVLLDLEYRIPILYSQEKKLTRVENIAMKLLDLFKIMNDKPIIRFWSNSIFAQNTAEFLGRKLQILADKIVKLGKVSEETRQSVCVVLDRSYDTLVPFIHDLTFESMIFDLLDVKGNTIELSEDGQIFKYEMNDYDVLWNDLRHKHIAYVLDKVPTCVKDFTVKNKIKMPEGETSLYELRKIISKYTVAMPEFGRLQALVVIASCLSKIYNERNLKEIIATEQDFASNVTKEGEPISDNLALYYSLMEDIQSPDDKLRLISLFALKNNHGVSFALLDKLLKMSGVDAVKQFIEALKAIGFPIVEDSGVVREDIIRVAEDSEIATGFNDSRFVPQIWGVIKNLFCQNLSESKFPFVGEAVNVNLVEEPQKKNYEFGKYTRRKQNRQKKNKPRIYLVFLGGICHAELRCIRVAQKLYSHCDIEIVSSEVFTPKTFISDLKNLKQ